MGGSLTAAASQDFTSISARGLSEFAPRLIELVADVAMNPTIPEDEVAILKQQHMQQASQQKASPQFLANRTFRRELFGSHPYARTSETEASLQGMDRAKLVAFHRDHYRPNNAFLLIVGAIEPEAAIAAAEKAFGGWARGDVPAPPFPPPPPLERPEGVLRPAAEQHPVVDRARQHRGEAERSAVVRAHAREHDLRRGVQLADRAEHPRGKGLHLFAAVRAHRVLPTPGFYRFAADVRNDVTGATLTEVFKEIDKMRAEGSDGAELQGAKQYLRGIFPIQTATQTGLSATLNNVYVFGLPKDYPEIVPGEDRRRHAGAGEDRRVDAAGLGAIRHRHRRRLREGEGSARRVQGHHVPRHRRQGHPAAAITLVHRGNWVIG